MRNARLPGWGCKLKWSGSITVRRFAEGRIMTQLPLPGSRVRRGWQVRVAQSLGPQRVAIPDVTKQSERAAEWNIQRRGLEVASTAEMQLPGASADQVLAQSPPANASQVAAPRTSLLVAVAADPLAYVMPNFVGQPLGNGEPHSAGCGLQTRERKHGAAAGEWRTAGCSRSRDCRATSTIASQHDRYAVAARGTEGSGGCGGELRSAMSFLCP